MVEVGFTSMSLSVSLTLKFIKGEKFRHYFLFKKKKELYLVVAAVFTVSMLTDTHTKKRWKAFLF